MVAGAPVRMHTRMNFLRAREVLLGIPGTTPGSGGSQMWREPGSGGNNAAGANMTGRESTITSTF